MENYCFDNMSGLEFEMYLEKLFVFLGYKVELTSQSNDYGADLILTKNNIKSVVQVKRYSEPVGVSAVQEAIGAMHYYQSSDGMVITNNFFTPNAISLAEKTKIKLINRSALVRLIISAFNPVNETYEFAQQKEIEPIDFKKYITSDFRQKHNYQYPLLMGKKINGEEYFTDLQSIGHLLIHGASGAGKSSLLHCFILNLIKNYNDTSPRFVLWDNRNIEFSIYSGISNLLVPVMTEARKTTAVLSWAVSEMLVRYEKFNDMRVPNIDAYNNLEEQYEDFHHLERIIIIFDEISPILQIDGKQFSDSISRILLDGGKAGIHCIFSTVNLQCFNSLKPHFQSTLRFNTDHYHSFQLLNLQNTPDSETKIIPPYITWDDISEISNTLHNNKL